MVQAVKSPTLLPRGQSILFTKALAKELAPSNIQVNAIACGAIDTEMNGHLSPEELQELAEEIPCGTLGSPYGVANLAKAYFKLRQLPYRTDNTI